MSKPQQEILEYLEHSYTGARMMDDVETMTKLSRAIAAFNAPTDKDIFTEEFMEEHIRTTIYSTVK